MPDGSVHRIVPEDVLEALRLRADGGDELVSDFPARLRMVRKAKDVGQDVLAKAVGISQSKLSRIESGETEAASDLQVKIWNALSVGKKAK